MRPIKYWPFAWKEHWFYIKAWLQKKFRGYSDLEVWNFYTSISKDIVKRLTVLRKNHMGYPASLNSDEEWNAILDKIILAYQLIADGDEDFIDKNDEGNFKWRGLRQEVIEGRQLFHDHFFGLWD